MELINSQNAANLIQIPISQEPSLQESVRNSSDGTLLGNSLGLNMPAFLNFGGLINPHILICGMTGSGKTYLAKSLFARMHMFSDSNALLVDFTGEYSDAASNLPLLKPSDMEGLFGEGRGVIYLDLHLLSEKEKVNKASEIFDRAAILMRRRHGQKNRLMILIDEAWKLIEKNKGLEIIIREGRKYGVGLITSSQLLHDISANVLSNTATLFIFKTTNGRSLETLSRSFNLSQSEIRAIQNLDLGSCLVIQLRSSGARSAFIIRKIIGIRDTNLTMIRTGEDMEIGISVTEFDEMVASLCGRDRLISVREKVRENSISLPDLIAKLIESGADRRLILIRLQKIGFSNSSIADSFAIAMGKIGA